MEKKILIIGSGGEGKSSLMLQAMREKYGDGVVFVTPEEAKEQGLTHADFLNLPTMEITVPPIVEHLKLIGAEKLGKENRRQRREQQRKANKK